MNLLISCCEYVIQTLLFLLFKKAIQLNPYDTSFYRNLALAYHQQGKKSEAEAVMEQMKWLAGRKNK